MTARIGYDGGLSVQIAKRFGGAVTGIGRTPSDRPDDPLSRSMAVKDWRRAACIGGASVIVTADHALDRDDEIRVELPDGGAVRGMLVGRDQRTDLAVLRIRAVGLPTARFGDAASLQIGHMVLAVGRHSERGLSASWGVISGFGRRRASAVGGNQSIYLDLTIYPGFSGGPLMADGGRILGINTLGSARRGAQHCPMRSSRTSSATFCMRDALGATKSMSPKNGDRSCGAACCCRLREGTALWARGRR